MLEYLIQNHTCGEVINRTVYGREAGIRRGNPGQSFIPATAYPAKAGLRPARQYSFSVWQNRMTIA